ncbi:MAG: BON domain-containing protein [Acidobacteria bacterium]|nr:BON domain-containing protein [Acidobacteriota bacterium]
MRARSVLGIIAAAALAAGCSRSDAAITTNIVSKLAADETVKSQQIDVNTKDRVVTLSGTVQNEAEEAKALEIARNTRGVANVVDDINVAPAGEQGAAPTTGAEAAPEVGAAPADSEIDSQVKAALTGEPSIKADQITVATANGVVTLSGKVSSEAQKTKAAEVAGKVPNVTRVDNELTVGK